MTESSPSQNWWMRSWFHRLEVNRNVPRFLKNSPEPFRGQVLEVGAGPGWTSKCILETFPQVELTASDIDEEATAQFSQLESIYGDRLITQAANVLELPFDREAFDFVLAINVLNSLPVQDVPQAVQQLLRVLRPGAVIGIYRCGLFAPATTTQEALEKMLTDEECDILSGNGGATYRIWARKSYPVKGGVVA